MYEILSKRSNCTMRIGILTLPLHTNYGGILQAYALQTVLERMGHEVVVFDTPNKLSLPPLWKRPLSYGKRVVLKAEGKMNRIFLEQYYNKTRPVIAQNIQPFIDKNINRKVVKKFTDLKSCDYETIVVGSDQIWRKKYYQLWLNKNIQNAYLCFTKSWNIKRISYAASFGTDEWEYTEKETQDCKSLLQSFDVVSVREFNGVNLCKKYFDVDAVHVLDPTMLLNREDYSLFFQKAKTPKSEGTLLNYILDETENTQKLIKSVAEQKGLKPFSVNIPFENDETKPLNERIKPSIETWLRGFYDAEFIVTDSFHACVFSISFNKPFYVIGNEMRGLSRFISLLKMFHLELCLITDVDNIEYQELDYHWNEVNAILSRKRNECLALLENGLSK